jgi:eukaryotic-like serine/threonine-protein kinase
MADRIGQQLGLYRLVRFIGRGSFAEVYLGEHVRLLTQAAVKVFPTQVTGEAEERFQEEVRVLARLGHPHIMPILDYAVQDGVPFLAMDYTTNGTLRRLFPKGTPQAPGAILPYMWQVADALHYAHGQHVIHRDVKPENMLLDAHNEVLLNDFSIGVVSQRSRYQATQEIVGAATYLAPEQIEALARPASDQYALAVLVYEWLSGTPPFEGSTKEVMAKHLFADPQPLHERVRTISPAVEAVIRGALSKDPADRFPSVESFAAALEQACQAVPALLFVPPRLIGSPETEEPDGTSVAEEQDVAESQPPAVPAEPPLTQDSTAPDAVEAEPAPAEPPTPVAEPLPAAGRAAPPQPAPVPPLAPSPLPVSPVASVAEVAPAPPAPTPILISPAALSAADWLTRPEPPVPARAPAFSAPVATPAIPPAAPVITPVTPPASPAAAPAIFPAAPVTPPAAPGAGVLPMPKKPTLAPSWREVSWIPAPPSPHAEPLPQPPPLEEPPRRLSRRAVLLGGAAGLTVVAGALAWLGISELGANPPRALAPTLTPISTQPASPTPTATPNLPGGVVYTYSGHSGPLRGVSWAPGGVRIASASDDHTVQVWDALTGANTTTYKGHSREVMAVAWSPSGTYLASGSQDQTLHVWDASSGATLQSFSFGHWVMAVAWSPNGKYLAAGSWDYTVQIWNTATWARIHQFNTPGWVNALAWSPDSTRLVTGDGAKVAIIWNVLPESKLFIYRRHTGAVTSLAWTPNGTSIASGAEFPDTTVQYWSALTGQPLWSANTQDHTPSLAWSFDASRLAAGGANVSLLNPTSGAQLAQYQHDAWTLAWSPDGKYIASGGPSTTVQVWRTT